MVCGLLVTYLGIPNAQLTTIQFQIHPQQSECSYSQNNRGARMSGIVRIKSGDESSLLSAVSSVGPVAVSVDASSNAFRVMSMF